MVSPTGLEGVLSGGYGTAMQAWPVCLGRGKSASTHEEQVFYAQDARDERRWAHMRTCEDGQCASRERGSSGGYGA